MPCASKKDEHLWTKAKAVAAKEGHAEEYDYITGIYNKMQGGKKNVFKIRKNEEKSEKTEQKLAASENLFGLTVLAKAHNQTKIKDLTEKLNQVKTKEERIELLKALEICCK